MIDVIPSLKELKRGLRNRHPKENLVYKIILDVLGHYLKDTNSKVRLLFFRSMTLQLYKKKFIAIATEFYESLSQQELN